MELWPNVSSYNGVSPQIEKKRAVTISFKLIPFISFIFLFFLLSPLSPFVFCSFWGQNVQAQNFTPNIQTVHPNQLVNTDDHLIEVRGENLDQISRIILSQSLPYIKSTLLTENNSVVTALDFQDPYVYAITDDSKISIINISDPNNPQITGIFDSFQSSTQEIKSITLRDIQVLGNYLFITDTPNGLWVLNISQPSSPEYIALQPENLAWAVYVEADTDFQGNEIYTIYLTSLEDGLLIYSWDGSQLEQKSKLPIPGMSTPLNLDIMLHPLTQEQYLYIANGDSVVMFKREGDSVSRVNDPNRPLNNKFFQEDPNNLYYSSICDVKVKNEYLYVLDNQYGLYVVDMGNPQVPTISHRLPLAADRESITIRNNLAVVAAGEHGLDLIDISLPSAPAFMHQLSTNGEAEFIEIEPAQGKYVFIANGNNGFALADIQPLMNHPSIGHLALKGNIENITLSENQAYVSTGESGLKIVDIQDPWAPRLSYSLEKSDLMLEDPYEDSVNVLDCCLYENGLYLANETTLCIFDNSNNQEKPSWVNEIKIPLKDPNAPPDKIKSIRINNNCLYMFRRTRGLEIFRIKSLLELPDGLGSFSTDSISNQNIWVEDYPHYPEDKVFAYLADGTYYFGIVDVSKPKAPVKNSYKNVGRTFVDVGVKGDYAYLIDGSYSSITVVKTNIHEENTDPEIIERMEIINDNYLVACSIWDDFLYAAGTGYGIWIIDISIPSYPIILNSLAIPRGTSAVSATQNQIYIGEQSDMLHIYSAPRNLPLLNPADPNQILDLQDPNRDPNVALFRIPKGLPSGFFDLTFLSNERKKIQKYKSLQIEKCTTIDLKAGLNLFGYPGKVPPEYLASDNLIKAIDSTGKVHSLRQENPTQISYWQSDMVIDPFTIADNRGYLLYLQEDKLCVDFRTSYYFPLEVILHQLGYELKEGAVHWISFPVKDEEQSSSFKILGKLKKLPGVNNLSKMQKLNKFSGKWESVYDFFDQQCGQNFVIKKGEGYLLYSKD